MSSRFWLALAVVVACGAEPAPAEASSRVVTITVDEAKIAKVPDGTSTLIIGNPMIADATLLKSGGAMVLTGKGYGETNLIALNSEGKVILEEQLRVLPPGTVLVFQNGNSRTSYSCNPACMPTVQLGDDSDVFSKAGAQISMHNGLAEGGASASASGAGK
jgi:hypothetical protein